LTVPVRVVLTIDTEEDDWGIFRHKGARVENIRLLPDLLRLWDRYGVRPTYFVNYPPLASREASEILRTLGEGSPCEMGVHCHPWNTPPLEAGSGRPASMMNCLSDDQNHAKLAKLAILFEDLFQQGPRAFRAGRWGFGPSVSRPLHRLGFTVDSSVTPLIDWGSPLLYPDEECGPDYTHAPRQPYRFHPDHPFLPAEKGELVEIPTSVGFLRGPPGSSAALRGALERSFLARLRVVGLLDSLGVLARRWLSPETSSGRDMVGLAKALTRRGFRVLDVTFHSPTLLPGATPFVRTDADKQKFLRKLEQFLEFSVSEGFVFATASEVAKAVKSGELPSSGSPEQAASE
jgi:hypothetical protein